VIKTTEYTDNYVNTKIENCQRLVDEAISDAQREVYQEYLDFWKKWKTSEKKVSREDQPLEVSGNEKTDMGNSFEESEPVQSLRESNSKSPEPEVDYETEFKKEFPGKQAYYNRNGKTHITKAFREFLNQEQIE